MISGHLLLFLFAYLRCDKAWDYVKLDDIMGNINFRRQKP